MDNVTASRATQLNAFTSATVALFTRMFKIRQIKLFVHIHGWRIFEYYCRYLLYDTYYRGPAVLKILICYENNKISSLPRYIIVCYNLIYGRFRFRTPCFEFTMLYSTYCYLFYIHSAPIIIIYNSLQAKWLSFDLSFTLPHKKVPYKKHMLTLFRFSLKSVSATYVCIC